MNSALRQSSLDGDTYEFGGGVHVQLLHPIIPFDRLRQSTAWAGVWTIGEPTFNEVLTDTSAPIRRPIAFK